MMALVLLLTAAVVAGGARLGCRCGGHRLLRVLAIGAGAWLAGLGATATTVRLGWFAPFGLITPLVFGGCTFVLVTFVLTRRRRRPAAARERVDRAAGAVLGGGLGGLAAASLWLLASVVASAGPGPAEARNPPRPTTPPAPVGLGGALQQLVETANRGFVRHLPLLGELSGEVEAVIYVLNTPEAVRRRCVASKGWDDLAALPAYRSLVDDAGFQREFAALRDGDVFALYRLQSNARLIAFLSSPPVRALLPGLRPSALAAEVRRTEAELAARAAAAAASHRRPR